MLISPATQHARIAATASPAVSFRLLMNTPTLLTRCSVSSVGRCRPTLPAAPAWHVAHSRRSEEIHHRSAYCQVRSDRKADQCCVHVG